MWNHNVSYVWGSGFAVHCVVTDCISKAFETVPSMRLSKPFSGCHSKVRCIICYRFLLNTGYFKRTRMPVIIFTYYTRNSRNIVTYELSRSRTFNCVLRLIHPKLSSLLRYLAGQFSRYSDWLRAGRFGDRIPVGARFSALQTGPGAYPAFCTAGTGSFPGVESGRGVTLTPHSFLVPRSKNRVELYLYSPYGPSQPMKRVKPTYKDT